jgi:V8-like Glu-specific endopeptidase
MIIELENFQFEHYLNIANIEEYQSGNARVAGYPLENMNPNMDMFEVMGSFKSSEQVVYFSNNTKKGHSGSSLRINDNGTDIVLGVLFGETHGQTVFAPITEQRLTRIQDWFQGHRVEEFRLVKLEK